MIPMRQFLREHSISGEVTECTPDPQDESPLDGASYRLALTNGQRSFETELHRPIGAPAPTLGEGLAEIARRASIGLHALDASAEGVVRRASDTTESIGHDAQSLRQFLGDEANNELLFEFGQRPEDQIEQGDTVGEPARPDEMTNQEPEALQEARRAITLPRAARYLVGVPVIAAGAAGIFFARGRRVAALSAAAGGTLAALGGAGAALVWRRSHDRQSSKDTMKTLTDQNAAIQTGGTP
jgi:hypothetical protein